MDENTVTVLLGLLLAISETLGLNPKWKSNSVLQLIKNVLSKIASFFGKKSGPGVVDDANQLIDKFNKIKSAVKPKNLK